MILKASFSLWLSRLTAIAAVGLSIGRAQVEGPNGHFYKVVMEPGLLWEEARDHAANSTFNGVHGYLATITSSDEDQFIENLRQQAAPGGDGSLWVGGSQVDTASLPTDGWYWVNGEGPIPTSAGGDGYSNWQPGEPDDFSGPGSEGYLSVGHSNQFGWNDEPNDRHIQGYVVEYPSRGTTSTVRVTAVDPVATESANDGTISPAIDSAVFVFRRDGDLSLDLPVFYSVHGTALNGSDYNEIAKSILIPVGQSEVKLPIIPKPDALAVVEPMETVGIRVEPSLINTPTSAYYIDQDHREAAAVIYEGAPPPRTSVEIAVPRTGFTYAVGDPVVILAALYSTQAVTTVNFYSDNQLIGSASDNEHTNGLRFLKFAWKTPTAGTHTLVARLAVAIDNPPSSKPATITIPETVQAPVVGIRFVSSSDPLPNADYAPGYLEVARSSPGTATTDLKVFYGVGGTATADVDYQMLQGYVVIPAGRSSAKIIVTAIDDTVAEPNETVVVTLTPAIDAPATPTDVPYTVDPDHASAVVVIYDNDSPPTPNANPLVKIVKPTDGATFLETDLIRIVAEAGDTDGTVAKIDLLVDGTVMASQTGARFEQDFTLAVGKHILTARATDNASATGVSPPVYILVRHPDTVAFVHRELPGAYTPGVPFAVELRADPPEGTFAYAVEDRPPTNWIVTAISDDGFFDKTTGKVKFGPFIDVYARTLTYHVTPPANTQGVFEFTGSSAVNGAVYPITGDVRIQLATQYHPADTNQDFSLSLAEVTAYTAAWKRGQSWPTGPVPIPLNYVTRGHLIWQHGEAYRFEPAAGAPPACWLAGTNGPRILMATAIGSAQRSVTGDSRTSPTPPQVQITVTPPAGASGYAVEEKPPRGWIVSNVSNEGVFDEVTGTIRWGVFADTTARTLTYSVTPPPTVTSVGVFGGQLSYDGQLLEIGASAGFTDSNSVVVNGTSPIRINNVSQNTSGFSLNISGPSGQTAVIETSSDFATWTEVKSIFIPNGAVNCTDDTVVSGNRFYRLRVQ